MKYEFIKNGIDDYTLKYKGKEINFNSNVGIVKKMQEANRIARLKMVSDLAKENMSIKDLIKETKKDGKTYYDNSSKEELEKAYIEETNSKIFLETIEELFKIPMIELLTDIGLTQEEEITKFSETLGSILVGQFPSK